jgi:hypothetical protein
MNSSGETVFIAITDPSAGDTIILSPSGQTLSGSLKKLRVNNNRITASDIIEYFTIALLMKKDDERSKKKITATIPTVKYPYFVIIYTL